MKKFLIFLIVAQCVAVFLCAQEEKCSYPYAGVTSTEEGVSCPCVGIKLQVKELGLDLGAYYGNLFQRGLNLHAAGASFYAIHSLVSKEQYETYAGIGLELESVQASFRSYHRRSLNGYLTPMVGVKHSIGEDKIVFLEVRVHPWTLPFKPEIDSKWNGSVLFKIGISL